MNEQSLYEAIADIAYIAGEHGYYGGDSRKDIADIIEWAKEFEAANKGVEWGNEKDYIEEIQRFAESKMR